MENGKFKNSSASICQATKYCRCFLFYPSHHYVCLFLAGAYYILAWFVFVLELGFLWILFCLGFFSLRLSILTRFFASFGSISPRASHALFVLLRQRRRFVRFNYQLHDWSQHHRQHRNKNDKKNEKGKATLSVNVFFRKFSFLSKLLIEGQTAYVYKYFHTVLRICQFSLRVENYVLSLCKVCARERDDDF